MILPVTTDLMTESLMVTVTTDLMRASPMVIQTAILKVIPMGLPTVKYWGTAKKD